MRTWVSSAVLLASCASFSALGGWKDGVVGGTCIEEPGESPATVQTRAERELKGMEKHYEKLGAEQEAKMRFLVEQKAEQEAALKRAEEELKKQEDKTRAKIAALEEARKKAEEEAERERHAEAEQVAKNHRNWERSMGQTIARHKISLRLAHNSRRANKKK